MSFFDSIDLSGPPSDDVDDNDDSNSGEIPIPATKRDTKRIDKDWKTRLDKKDDKIDSTLHNARLYLENHEDFVGNICWNTYAKKLDILGGPLKDFSNLDPEDMVAGIQDYLAHTHKISVSFSDLSRRIVGVAKQNEYDPLINYLTALAPKWDGTSRIDDFFLRYFGAGKIASNTPTKDETQRIVHLKRIGRRWLLGAVERALVPGCKVDNILILEGLQGARKTSTLEALGGEFYCSTQITLGDKDSKMIAASNWLVDMPDTKFMKKDNRGFITTRADTFRPPFGASVKATKRRCIMIGSMNDYQYLDEEERRYWPVRCDQVDLAALMRDRDQIWAEAANVALASKTCPACLSSNDTVFGQLPRCAEHRWWLNSEEEKESLIESADRIQDVPWKLRIHEWWLDMEPSKRPEYFTAEDVATKALKIDEDRFAQNRGTETSIGMAVRALGFRKERIMISGIRHWVYKPTDILARMPRVTKVTRTTTVSAFEVIPGGK